MIVFDRIVDEVFVGTAPASRIDVSRLAQGGFSAILNLQTDGDFRAHGIDWPALERHYFDRDLATYRVPIVDFDDDDLSARIESAAQTLDGIVAHHNRVYVHCTAGMQRSPSVVIAWLAWHRGLGMEPAIEAVMSARRCDPPLHVLRAVDQQRADGA